MATNGNNNGGNIDFTSKPNLDKGISGYRQGNLIKQEFTDKVFRDGGYLSDAINELKEQLKIYEDISFIVEKMSKSDRLRHEKTKNELKNQLDLLNKFNDNKSATDKEMIKALKESGKMILSSGVAYQDTLTKAKLNLDKMNKAERDSAKKRIDDLDKYSNKLAITKELVSEVNSELDETNRQLQQATKTFGESLSETLENAGDKLANLSNMFNLEKIANSAMEQSSRSKSAIRGNVMRQFGFTNNSQFESFKNSLNNTLKDMNRDMGSIFNSEDMKNYMMNLQQYGITSTDMAKQQMKSSIIAEKYLGVSAETQTAIFKYMKMTNNNEVLNKHNRMMVGLLKSQLGVSKEQLDILSTQTYSDADALAALGVDESTRDRYIETSTASKTALDSINKGWGNAVGNIFNEMIAMPYNEMMTKYTSIFGGETDKIYSQLVSGNADIATKMILTNPQLRNMLSTGDTRTQSMIQDVLGIKDVGSLANISRYFSTNGTGVFDKKLDEAIKAIKNTTDSDVTSYIEQSQEATWLEKIKNQLDVFINGINWKTTMKLANLAFTAYLASAAVKGWSKLTEFFGGKGTLGSNIIKGQISMDEFATGKGTAGKALGALGAGAAVVGLTAMAIKGISDMTQARHQKDQEAMFGNRQSSLNALKGTAFEGNTGMADILSYSNSAGVNKREDTLGNRLYAGFIEHGWSNFWGSANNALVGWTNKFNMDDPRKYNTELWKNYMAERRGKYTPEQMEAAIFTYMAMLYELGAEDAISDLFGSADKNTVAAWLNQKAKENPDNLTNLLVGIQREFNTNDLYPVGANRRWFDGQVDWDKWVSSDGSKFVPYSGGSDLYPVPSSSVSSSNHNGRGGDSSSWTSMIHSPWYRVTSMWGNRPNPFGGGSTENHGGIDIAAPAGTPIGSAVSGKVTTAGWVSGFGNAVYIQGDNGMKYIYAHMVEQPAVKAGQTVKAGQFIGKVGSTGRSTGNHLHFQVGTGWYKSNSVDPVPYLNTGVLYPGGVVEGVKNYSPIQTSTTGTSEVTTPTVKQNRFIPTAFLKGAGGPADSTNRIVGSVDGGINRLISYLDGIRSEQNEQRAILDAFSRSRMSESSF